MPTHDLYDTRRELLHLSSDMQDQLWQETMTLDLPDVAITYRLSQQWSKERYWHLGDYYKLFTDGSQAPDKEAIRQQWMRARGYAELCVRVCRGQSDERWWDYVVAAHATFSEYEYFEFALWLLDSVCCDNDISDPRYYGMITDTLRRLPNEVLYYAALLKRYPLLQLLIVADSLAATQKEFSVNRPMWLVCYRALHDQGMPCANTFTTFVNYMNDHNEWWQLLWQAYKLSPCLVNVKQNDAHKNTRHYVGYMETPYCEWTEKRDKALALFNKTAMREVDRDDLQLTWPLKNDIHTSYIKLAHYIKECHLRLNDY